MSIEVLHLSDTHIGASATLRLGACDPRHSLRRVCDNARGLAVDFALLTGDLSNDATPAAYHCLAQQMARLATPDYALPGNHDDPQTMRAELARSCISCPTLIARGTWSLALLDSTVPGELAGTLSAASLRALAALSQHRPEIHLLVALHHPPVDLGSPWMDSMGLSNAPELWRVLHTLPQLRAVIWGHAHQNFDTYRRGVRLLGTPSTNVQFMPRVRAFAADKRAPGYRVLTLNDDGTIATEVVRVARADHDGCSQARVRRVNTLA